MNRPSYPFAAIVGQQQMKRALILTVICPELSGVLIRGEKGTAKSTAVRALAQLLPTRVEVTGNPFHLTRAEYDEFRDELDLPADPQPPVAQRRVQVVELPVGASEDRVTGTIDLEAALAHGKRRFQPGLLASAHRGILYVDEVNLLDDHVVDLLLDSAAMGVNSVEREGISLTHPARFALVGTMNPEEGELRPQLLDRFGMCVEVHGESELSHRVEVISRRLEFERDPQAFCALYRADTEELTNRIARATQALGQVHCDRGILTSAAQICLAAGVDGHRGDIMMLRAARALAAWYGRAAVSAQDLDQAAALVLPHRLRRQPLEPIPPPGR